MTDETLVAAPDMSVAEKPASEESVEPSEIQHQEEPPHPVESSAEKSDTGDEQPAAESPPQGQAESPIERSKTPTEVEKTPPPRSEGSSSPAALQIACTPVRETQSSDDVVMEKPVIEEEAEAASTSSSQQEGEKSGECAMEDGEAEKGESAGTEKDETETREEDTREEPGERMATREETVEVGLSPDSSKTETPPAVCPDETSPADVDTDAEEINTQSRKHRKRPRLDSFTDSDSDGPRKEWKPAPKRPAPTAEVSESGGSSPASTPQPSTSEEPSLPDVDAAPKTVNNSLTEKKKRPKVKLVPERRKKVESGPSVWNCLFCTKNCTSWRDLQIHLVQEKGIKIYACHLCSKGFLSKSGLVDHSCPISTKWKALKNDPGTLVRVCYQFILCGCCGLQLPLWKETSSRSYSILMQNHCLDQLRNLTVYAPQRFSTAPNTSISVDFVPHLQSIPLKCRQCSLQFKTAVEIHKHSFVHPTTISISKCPECPSTFGSELFFRSHLVGHQNDDCNLLGLMEGVPEDAPPEKPSKSENPYGPDELVNCDLCGSWVNARSYNETHDCAIEFTRRLLVGEHLVRCPSVSMDKANVLLNSESSYGRLTASLGDFFKQTARIKLVPEKALGLDDLEDLRKVARDYLACSFCCTTLDGMEKMSEHLRVVHKKQLPQKLSPSELSGFCMKLNQSVMSGGDEVGLACPRCHQLQCSVFGLRRHLVVNHNQWIPGPFKKPPAVSPESARRQVLKVVPVSRVSSTQSNAFSSTPITPTIPLSQVSARPTTTFTLPRVGVSGGSGTLNNPAISILANTSPQQQQVLRPTSQAGVFILNATGAGGSVQRPSTALPSHGSVIKLRADPSPSQTMTVTEQRDGLWFCPICSTKFPGVLQLRNHLEECHIFICHFCAGCYVSNENFKNHLGSCKKGLRQDSTIFFCYLCSLSFVNLKLYYTHLIQTHASKVTFDSTGQMYPICGALLQKPKSTVYSAHEVTRLGRADPPSCSVSVISKMDDDEPVVVLEEKTPPSSSKTGDREIEKKEERSDSPMDDELMIVDGDEEEGGRKVIRLKTHSCMICSQKFQTVGGLKDHIKTHAFDAGSTTTEVLPCPLNSVVWICRMCSLAYESQSVYQAHASKHGRFNSCQSCTAVCFTDQQLANHQQAHDHKKIVYGCAQCMKAFAAEFQLYSHMQVAHGMVLLWLCKMCGYGHSRREQLRHHMVWFHRLDSQAKRENGVGVTAHCKLHYQPADPDSYIQNLQHNAELANVKVGECAHRSFLTYNETMLGCDTCGSLVPASKLLLENESLRKNGQQELVQLSNMMGRQQNSAPLPNPGVSLRPSLQSRPMTTYSTARVVVPSQIPGTTLRILNNSQAPLSRPRQPPPPPLPAPQRGSSPDIITVGGTDGQRCGDCGEYFGSVASLKVHMLKHNVQDGVFCLECGSSFRKKYSFQCHCVSRHQVKLNYKLNCPKCSLEINWTGSDSLQALLNHMERSNCFRTSIKCSYCHLRLTTNQAAERHSQEHRRNGSFGCILCGQCFGSNALLKAHAFHHACLEWLMCRECGLCFQKSYQLESHFRAEHLTVNVQTGIQCCKVCGPQHHLGSRDQFVQHIADKHQVFGFKMKPVITANEEFAKVTGCGR